MEREFHFYVLLTSVFERYPIFLLSWDIFNRERDVFIL